MLTQVAEGVLMHRSEFLRSNAVVVRGRAGVLLIDPGVQEHEMACLADDLSAAGHTVVAGFSTLGRADEVHARIARDRAYVLALRAGDAPDDPRIGPSAEAGWEWVSDVHDGQAERLAARGRRDGTHPGPG